MNLLIISGSRNPEGQTGRAARAFGEGLTSQGVDVEIVFLPTMSIDRCRQCGDDGWGLCRKEGRCIIEDDLHSLIDRIRSADAVAFATPVYFSDLSESLKSFLDRLRRTAWNEAGKPGIAGKPALGICVAGGGGGGAPACAQHLERILHTCGFDVVDMIPARRQNLNAKLEVLRSTGAWLACTVCGDTG